MKRPRLGAAIAMVLVAMAIASVLIASQASMILARQRVARQARAKVQAQWLAESALDRARLLSPRPASSQVWRPDTSNRNSPEQQTAIRSETDARGISWLIVVARVGKEGNPAAAQHTLREALSEETEP